MYQPTQSPKNLQHHHHHQHQYHHQSHNNKNLLGSSSNLSPQIVRPKNVKSINFISGKPSFLGKPELNPYNFPNGIHHGNSQKSYNYPMLR